MYAFWVKAGMVGWSWEEGVVEVEALSERSLRRRYAVVKNAVRMPCCALVS